MRGKLEGARRRVSFALLLSLPVLAAAVAAGVTSAPPAQAEVKPCSELYRLGPKGKAPGYRKPPLLVGDSVVGYAMEPLRKLGYRINAQGCRTFPRGIRAIKDEAKKRKLPKLIVVALGTAGNVKPQNIKRLLDFIGPKRKLVLVTPRKFGGRTFKGGIDPDAKDFHRAAEKYPDRVFVVPWAEFSDPHPEWFYPDKVHPNPEGQKYFVDLLEAALYV